MAKVTVEGTEIPGLLVVRVDVRTDERGWFKENWNRQAATAAGMPDLGPVQHNISFNSFVGVTRGVHAEPWDKLVGVATGRVFGAWVDLRDGPTFGRVVHRELDPATCVLVPRGVGNAFQVLADATAYTYLVNDHWRPDLTYAAVDVADPALDIPWPIPLDRAVLSEKDKQAPALADVTPFPAARPLVIGADGQLGRALLRAFPDALGVDRPQLDITDPAAVAAWPWRDHDVVLNAAAYTAVDRAETPDGRRDAWRINAEAPALLARETAARGVALVHYSTDYVFDGTVEEHVEDEPLSPLGVYGQSKAAGEIAVTANPQHYVLRTSWLVGDGPNFVRTMQRLAAEGVCPEVVDDQRGRLTFADELARATRHLVETKATFGTYHVTNGGPVTSWADIAKAVYEMSGRYGEDVRPVTTAHFLAGRDLAPRPAASALDLSSLRATGFEPEDAKAALERYLADQ